MRRRARHLLRDHLRAAARRPAHPRRGRPRRVRRDRRTDGHRARSGRRILRAAGHRRRRPPRPPARALRPHRPDGCRQPRRRPRPNFAVVLAARLLVGVSVGGFWAIAGGLAVRLVPQRHVGRATALVFGGVPTASVLGVPAGTLLGELGGWRTAFAAVGALGLVTLAALLLLLPPLPPTRHIGFPELPALLRENPAVRAGVIVTFLVVTGQFAAYTFVRPILQDVSGIDADYVSTLLLGYGLAGVAGNFLAGARDAYRTLLVVSASLTVILALIAVLPGPVAGTTLLLAWGLVYGGVSVSLQSWMIKAAPAAAEAAFSLMVAVFNLAIAAGALFGGLAVDGISAPAAPLGGAALMLVAAGTVWATAVRRRPDALDRAAG
ncbi:MFS transporter [Streptomyces sp. MS1.HAVA.3]|uniref:MFS transporter n=1 Tax=Streptomyces caledonius TaxID=3134107 RepID=A0ABU8UD74_9ACTN